MKDGGEAIALIEELLALYLPNESLEMIDDDKMSGRRFASPLDT